MIGFIALIWVKRYITSGEIDILPFSKSILKKCYIWDKVFKSGPSKICETKPLKNLPYLFKLFKACLLQILLGPLLNTLSNLILVKQLGLRRKSYSNEMYPTKAY